MTVLTVAGYNKVARALIAEYADGAPGEKEKGQHIKH